MKYRKKLSRSYSKRSFKNKAKKTNVMNVQKKVSRGGIQL